MLQNHRVVVLGGTSGIGLAVAGGAAREGAHVVVASSRQVRVDDALAKLPKGSEGYPIDLRDLSSIEAFFDQVGPFDHLVSTAGDAMPRGALASIDLEQARAAFEIRYWGVFAAVRAASRQQLSRDGSITLTSGTASTRPKDGFAVGASIGGAVEAFARMMALELAPVRVNVIAPGLVDTGPRSNMAEQARVAMLATVAAKIPVRRVVTAEEFAEAYLTSMRNKYMTGQTLIVDGGSVLV